MLVIALYCILVALASSHPSQTASLDLVAVGTSRNQGSSTAETAEAALVEATRAAAAQGEATLVEASAGDAVGIAW